MLKTKCDVDVNIQKLCPLSLGSAIGVTSFIAVLIWTLWVMHYGMSPMMLEMHIPMPTLSDGFVHALFALLKGFVFGFFVALFYDLFACCFACCFAHRKSHKKRK